MVVLQIEHPVPDYDGWKKAFDNDPVNRRQSGVKRYRVFRKTDDPKYVVIDLEFELIAEAEAMLQALKKLWSGAGGKVMTNPQTRMLELMENVVY